MRLSLAGPARRRSEAGPPPGGRAGYSESRSGYHDRSTSTVTARAGPLPVVLPGPAGGPDPGAAQPDTGPPGQESTDRALRLAPQA